MVEASWKHRGSVTMLPPGHKSAAKLSSTRLHAPTYSVAMAYVIESFGAGGKSGRVGDLVFAQTQGGTIARVRPKASRWRSPAQVAQERRLARCKRVWDTMGREEVALWRAYSLERAAALPVADRKRLASAWALFSGLGSKFLQVHGGEDVPRVPPTGRFLGDAIGVTVEGATGPEWATHKGDGLLLRFVADGTNREGVLTELMAQPLSCAHNLPRPKSYVALGFAAMAAGSPVEVPVSMDLHWACAVRFVEAATGRATGLVEIGTATIPLG